MDKSALIDIIFKEVERVKREGNFHVTGDVYAVLADLQKFLLDLKTDYDTHDM